MRSGYYLFFFVFLVQGAIHAEKGFRDVIIIRVQPIFYDCCRNRRRRRRRRVEYFIRESVRARRWRQDSLNNFNPSRPLLHSFIIIVWPKDFVFFPLPADALCLGPKSRGRFEAVTSGGKEMPTSRFCFRCTL